MEKKKPGTLAKVFSTHPITSSRIKAAQDEIQKILVARPEYVIDTSEFSAVKTRLMMLHNRRKFDAADFSRPWLRSAPGRSGGPVNEGSSKDQKPASDDRPTLKRRPDL
jgi:hypothetical protein